MFQTNEYVFYASGGICRIVDIQTAPLDGMPQDKQYYILHSVHDQNSVMYIPVDSDCVFLRRIMTREEAESLLSGVTEASVFEAPNAKALRDRYQEAMRRYQPIDWIRVIKTVRMRMSEQGTPPRRISETERTFAETAKKFLFAELSLSLDEPREQIESRLAELVGKI